LAEHGDLPHDFLGGARLNPKTDGRPDRRPTVRENVPQLGNVVSDFDFSQPPFRRLILDPDSGRYTAKPDDRLTTRAPLR
jgi:hypothetical protein